MRKNIFVFAAMTFMAITITAIAAYAQSPSKAADVMKEMVNKYETTDGVECIVATKGNGLELIKMMFNKELGKGFMKGVNSITIIEYNSASQATCTAIKNDLEQFQSILQEFEINDKEASSENKLIRCFASAGDANTIADFLMLLEDDSSKMLIYMEGKIVVEM